MLETTQDIIDAFEVYIGDSTVLSSVDELALAEKWYRKILDMHEWEFLKKEATGTVSGLVISQPTDFKKLVVEPTIYLGEHFNPFQVIPFSERRVYKGQNNAAYYDALNEVFTFFVSQNDSYSFDYIYNPEDLTTGTAPVWPKRYNYAIMHLMCTDSDIIELSEKARSYRNENTALATDIINDMRNWSDAISNYRTSGI